MLVSQGEYSSKSFLVKSKGILRKTKKTTVVEALAKACDAGYACEGLNAKESIAKCQLSQLKRHASRALAVSKRPRNTALACISGTDVRQRQVLTAAQQCGKASG
eukprot:6184771-Pleurochrysis_carterae.AAC.1